MRKFLRNNDVKSKNQIFFYKEKTNEKNKDINIFKETRIDIARILIAYGMHLDKNLLNYNNNSEVKNIITPYLSEVFEKIFLRIQNNFQFRDDKKDNRDQFLKYYRISVRGITKDKIEGERKKSNRFYSNVLPYLIRKIKYNSDSIYHNKFDPEIIYINKRSKKRIKNIIEKNIQKLTIKQEKVIREVFFQNKKQKEIANEMGCSAANITKLKNKGLKNLKKEIDKDLLYQWVG